VFCVLRFCISIRWPCIATWVALHVRRLGILLHGHLDEQLGKGEDHSSTPTTPPFPSSKSNPSRPFHPSPSSATASQPSTPTSPSRSTRPLSSASRKQNHATLLTSILSSLLTISANCQISTNTRVKMRSRRQMSNLNQERSSLLSFVHPVPSQARFPAPTRYREIQCPPLAKLSLSILNKCAAEAGSCRKRRGHPLQGNHCSASRIKAMDRGRITFISRTQHPRSLPGPVYWSAASQI
jgi:hypothetical protein